MRTTNRKNIKKKKDLFGVIVFGADQDLEPKTAYTCYADRWLLELVFNHYRSDDGCWIHVSKDVFAEMEALELSAPVPKPELKKRGRPKKSESGG